MKKAFGFMFAVVASFVIASPSFATHFAVSQIVVPVQTVQTITVAPVVQTVVAAPIVQAVQVQSYAVPVVQVQHVQAVQQVQCISNHCGAAAVRVNVGVQRVQQQRIVQRSVTRIR